MAENIKIGVDVDDGGSTKKLVKDAKELKGAYEGAASAASTLSKMGGVKATTAPKTTAAISGASQSSSDLLDYNQAKGIAGATGAAGRDFAKQAQGLGGLVHVYATFAANLFAVSAAFRALSAAADTTNMVKGLDALGAASGKSLGALSKQIVETTGGAISLRDAMTSVAQASSAGLGNKQINDIAVVATKASNALGISMTDAISRLSRGISKIEPELLDELGIFVKVDEATQKYALSVGKTVGSLSDFEKRQAFANAVLEQGKAKFAAIEAAPNPYDKLLASITNLGTAGLELVNKVLGPIANLLASSPIALSTAFAGIVGLLLKQAIPAIGQFREGLKKSADDALNAAERFKSGFGDEFQTRLEKLFKIPDLQNDLKKLEANLNSVKIPDKLLKTSVGKLLTTSDEDTRALANANKALDLRNTLIETGKKGSKDATAAQIEAAKQERDAIEKVIAIYEKRMQVKEAFSKAQTVADKPQGILDPEVIALKRYQEMRQKATQYEAVANAANNAQIIGVTKSWALLNQEIEEKGITGIDKYVTLTKGGLAAVGSRVMGIASAFSNVFQVIGIGVAIYSVWDSYASKATKQQEDFNTKVEASATAVKTVNDTFDLYTKKSANAFSIDAIGAYTTALAGVSDSLDAQILSFNKFNEAAGAWDRFKDSVGKTNLDKLQAGTVDSVKAVVKSLELSGASQQGKGVIAKALFGPDANPDAVLGSTEELSKAFDGLTQAEREEKIKKIAEAIGKVKEQEEYSTNAAKAFIESLTAIDKLVDQMIQANAFTDLQGKLGVELVQASDKLAQALIDPLKALEDMAKLGKDPKALAVLGNVDMEGLKKAAEYTKKLSDAEKELGKTASDLEKARAGQGKLAGAEREAASSFQFNKFANRDTINAAQQQDIANAQKAADKARKDLESLKLAAADFSLSQTRLVTQIADAGFAKVELGLKRAKELADISVTRTALGVASSLGADTSSQEYKLKLQEIDIQKSLIEASYNAQIATNRNTEELTKLNASQQILAAEALRNKQGATAEELNMADIMAKSATKILASIEAKRNLKEGGSEAEVTRLYGKEAVLSAKSSINTDKIPGMQKAAALAMENAKAESALIEKNSKELEAQARKVADKNAVQKEGLTIQQEILNLASQLNSYSSAAIIDAKSASQQKALELDTETKIAKIKSDQARLDLQRVKDSIDPDEYKRLTELNNSKLQNIEADKQAKSLAIEINSIRDKGSVIQSQLAATQAIESEKLRLTNSYEEAKIANLQKQLDIKLQLGFIDEQTAARAKGQLELQAQDLKYQAEKQRIEADILAKQAALDTAKSISAALPQQGMGPPTPEQSALSSQALTGELNAQAQLDNASLALDINTKNNNLTVEAIKANTELNAKLAEQRDHLDSISSVTQNLSDVFGKFGKSLGGVISSLDTMATNQEKRAQKEKNIVAQLKTGAITEQQAADQREKNTIQEINDQSRLAGAVASMFDKKTKIYKVFHALEIGLKVASLALELKTQGAKIAAWWAAIPAKAASETALTGVEAAGAAARAPLTYAQIVGQYLKSIPAPFGMILGVAAGALFLSLLGKSGGGAAAPGGFTAKEQQEVQGTGQTYDETGKLVDRAGGALGDSKKLAESVKTSIETLGKNFFGIFDTDNSKMIQALHRIADNTAQTAIALLQGSTGLFGGANPFGFQEGSSKGFLGFSKTSKSIADEGIKVEGTLGNLANGIGNFSQYINTITTSSSWWGLSKSSSFNSALADLNETAPKAVEALMKVFTDVQGVLLKASKYIYGEGSTVVDNIIQQATIKIKASSKGLSASEFADKLLAEVSVQLNAVAEQAFPELAGFRRLGEEMYQTVARLIKDSQTINDGFAMIGMSAKTFTGTMQQVVTDMDGMVTGITNIAIDSSMGLTAIATLQQNLLTASGGADAFASGMTKIFNSFYTSGEKFNLTFNRMNQLFKDAGIQLPKTKEEYLSLIKTTTDVTTLGFLIQHAGDYLDLLDLQNSAMSDTIKNLEDTISSFKDFAKNIKTFRENLYLGSASVATPTEKLATARSSFDTLYNAALSGDKTAMSQLTGAAQTLLDLGKTVYASSDQYTTLFDYVNTMLGTAETKAQDTVDIATSQLAYAKSTVDLLDNIDTNIAALSGGTPITAHALGGMASGWALVGEQGPEMVNFSNPGQVYTADQTAGMFAPNNNMGKAIGDMIVEIQQLREEVCSLRKDQQKQTGDIIVSNYDAQQKSSDEIAQAVVNASKDTVWKDRSKSEIK